MVKSYLVLAILLLSKGLNAQVEEDSIKSIETDSIHFSNPIWDLLPKLNDDKSMIIDTNELYTSRVEMKELIELVGEISKLRLDTLVDTSGTYSCKFRLSINTASSYDRPIDFGGKHNYESRSIQVTRESINPLDAESRTQFLVYHPQEIRVESSTQVDLIQGAHSYDGKYLIFIDLYHQPGGATFWNSSNVFFYEKE